MKARWMMLAGAALLAAVFAMAGCEGDDGATGAAGDSGPAGPAGPPGPPGEGVDVLAMVKPESCSTCHGGAGAAHQDVYDRYVDAGILDLEILGVSSVDTGAGGPYDVTVTISVEKGGIPFTSGITRPTLAQQTFYVVQYFSGTRLFDNLVALPANSFVNNGDGTYTVTVSGVSYAPELSNALVYGYIAQDPLDTEPAGRIVLYDNMDSAALAFGDVDTYVSAANVEGCIACHGEPYRKHGYREAVVAGLPDFVACKSCHYDSRPGTHPDWQQMVDDPLLWATTGIPAGDTRYDYTATVLNDVHMSHAMEFPYPMSMANCATCHEGKLDMIFDDDNFTAETCQSCHPVQAQVDYPTQPGRAPALQALWTAAGVTAIHTIDANCQGCHTAAANVGSQFGEYHSGYDKVIYTATGEKYAELNTVSIDAVGLAGNVMDIRFSSSNLSVVPMVGVSFYGWDTKDYLVSQHTRDANGVRMEKTIGTANPLFTEEADSVPGNWHVTLDLSAYAAVATDNIPGLIASGDVSKAEVAVFPRLDVDGVAVALNATTRTFDLATGAFVEDYFEDDGALASVEKCNACHDVLGSTFHIGSGRGGSIVACRTCHVTTNGGSHLEMQSRSIDSYAHAIHSFQAFDSGDIDFNDPVEAKRYALHVEHTFPNFTAKNCEGCHVNNAAIYDVPDQSRSMPGLLSASDTWNVDRNIGTFPEYVTGPASRACGGCHRANLIAEDAVGDLVSFNSHTDTFGYLVENDDDDSILYGVINKIMSLFK